LVTSAARFIGQAAFERNPYTAILIEHKPMDLNIVIAELRAELETVKQVTSALEKLSELRRLRESTQEFKSEAQPETPRLRKRKRSEEMAMANDHRN
jgi:hypothetical protein